MSWSLIIKIIVGASALMSLCINIGIIIYLFNRHKNFRNDVITKVLASNRFSSLMNKQKIDILNESNRSPLNKEKLIDEILDEIQKIEGLNKK